MLRGFIQAQRHRGTEKKASQHKCSGLALSILILILLLLLILFLNLTLTPNLALLWHGYASVPLWLIFAASRIQ
jgi:uncharacterized integral membrane protein